jgi:hypothetical protein
MIENKGALPVGEVDNEAKVLRSGHASGRKARDYGPSRRMVADAMCAIAAKGVTG